MKAVEDVETMKVLLNEWEQLVRGGPDFGAGRERFQGQLDQVFQDIR